MTDSTIAQFKSLGSNSEAKKMFALDYFTRAMERFETGGGTPRSEEVPSWAAWTKVLAKSDGVCNADGCTKRWKKNDVVWAMYGKKPRCFDCGKP